MLTFEEVRDLAKEYVRVEAQPYVDTDGKWTAVINEACYKFSVETLCIPGQTRLLTTPAKAIYELESDLDLPMALATRIISDQKIQLTLVGRDYVDRASLQPAGRPRGYAYYGEGKIRFTPTPDDAYELNVFGYLAHPLVDYEGAEILIPRRYMRTLAVYAAALALDPRASGSSLEKMARLSIQAASEMGVLMDEAQSSRREARPDVVRRSSLAPGVVDFR